MADWIHCNKCATRFNINITFFLTECGHISCHRCVERIKTSGKCCVCNKPTSVVALNKDLDPSVYIYFQSFEEVNKKMIEVYNYQLKHRTSLFQSVLNKYFYAKKECIKSNDVIKKLIKENKMLKSALQIANTNCQHFVTSTPTVSGNITTDRSDLSSTILSKFSMGTATNKSYPGFPLRQIPAQHLFTPSQVGSPSEIGLRHRQNNRPTPVHHPHGGLPFSLDELRRCGQSK